MSAIATSNTLFNALEVRKALSTILASESVFELRALDAALNENRRIATVSGYFDNLRSCLAELEKLNSARGIYFTMNPVDRALLARCQNRLAYAERGSATSDQHVIARRWLLIDVDADRPAGISSSNQEKQSARTMAGKIQSYLFARSWPSPVFADSGNGYHLVYRIDLPRDDGQLLEQVLGALADRFAGDGVKIDRTVHNPARIVRLYGTKAAKGDSTLERPHRFSKILLSSRHELVNADQLRALVAELRPKEPAQVQRPPALAGFDVEGFLQRHNVEVSSKTQDPGGTSKWGLARCPFNHDHVDGEAAVFQFPDGKLGFNCFHDFCQGKHWKDFRRHFEPVTRQHLTSTSTQFPDPRGETPNSVDVDELEPLPEQALPYVPPPLDLLPLVLREYVAAASDMLTVDETFVFLPLLSSLGGTIGNSRSIMLKHGFSQPPVIWTGIVGASGARKSPAINLGCFAATERERVLARQNHEASEIYKDEISDWQATPRKLRGEKPEKPKFLAHLIDDLTIEVLGDLLETNPRGLLVRKDELAHWFSSFDQYRGGKGGDVTRWLSLHSAFYFAVDRRSEDRHYRLFDPRVCITGGIQPKVLKRVLTEDFFDRGLPARFLFAYPPFKEDKWSEATIPDDIRLGALMLFENLWFLFPEQDGERERPIPLKPSKEAKELFVSFYNTTGRTIALTDDRTGASWSKLLGYAARLALVGQLARNPNSDRIEPDTMQAAITLAEWFGHEAERIYGELSETEAEREQRELVEFIERRGGIVSVRDVTHGCRTYRGQSDEAERVLSALVQKGSGEWLKPEPGSRGQPSKKFRLRRVTVTTNPPKYEGKSPNTGDGDTAEREKNAAPVLVRDEMGIGAGGVPL